MWLLRGKKEKTQQIIKRTLRETPFLLLSQAQPRFNTSLSSFLGSTSLVFAKGYMQSLPIPVVNHLVAQEAEVSNGLFLPLSASYFFPSLLCVSYLFPLYQHGLLHEPPSLRGNPGPVWAPLWSTIPSGASPPQCSFLCGPQSLWDVLTLAWTSLWPTVHSVSSMSWCGLLHGPWSLRDTSSVRKHLLPRVHFQPCL